MRLIHSDAYNQITNNSTYFNCLAFALGQTDFHNFNLEITFDYQYIPLNKSFLSKAKDLGIRIRQVTSIDDLTGKVGFIVYGWYGFADFHVVRSNPDGTFEHKPGYLDPATPLTSEDIYSKESSNPFYFVLEEDYEEM